MKKIILCSLLFLSLFWFSSKTALAVCYPAAIGPNPCGVGGGSVCAGILPRTCCNPSSDCATYTTPVPTTAPGPAGSCGDGAIYTAIGCIPYNNMSSFMGFVLGWGIGIGGGIAFLLIIFAGFQILTSSGDPTRLKAGQELLTSAITGLIMLVFSVYILRLIGVNILRLSPTIH